MCAEADGLALAALGVFVQKRFEAALPCKGNDRIILRDDEHTCEFFPRDGVQRVPDERPSVIRRAEQFIFAKALGISGCHEQAADSQFLPHRDHPFLTVRFLHYNKGKRVEQAEKTWHFL